VTTDSWAKNGKVVTNTESDLVGHAGNLGKKGSKLKGGKHQTGGLQLKVGVGRGEGRPKSTAPGTCARWLRKGVWRVKKEGVGGKERNGELDFWGQRVEPLENEKGGNG